MFGGMSGRKVISDQMMTYFSNQESVQKGYNNRKK